MNVVPLPAADEAPLPSVDQILDKYVAASGGREAIEKLTSRMSKGTIEIPTFNASGTYEQYNKANRQVTISKFEGYGVVTQCFDGQAGWASDPQQGMRDMSGHELALTKRAADLQGVLHTKQHYKTLAVSGKGKVGDHDAYILDGVLPEGGTEKLYFDTQSGLLLRMETPIENATFNILFEDYRDVEGMKLPATIKQESPQISIIVKVQETKNNVPVDDDKFAKPAK